MFIKLCSKALGVSGKKTFLEGTICFFAKIYTFLIEDESSLYYVEHDDKINYILFRVTNSVSTGEPDGQSGSKAKCTNFGPSILCVTTAMWFTLCTHSIPPGHPHLQTACSNGIIRTVPSGSPPQGFNVFG